MRFPLERYPTMPLTTMVIGWPPTFAVPMLYPKLSVKFGKPIAYRDDPFSQLRTEFGFDGFQAAKGRYAPDGYKDFIGFESRGACLISHSRILTE
jgi:hypothetical protein